MKKLFFFVPMLALVMLASCGDKLQKQVKNFATDFAQKVSKNQVDSIRAMYPDAAKIDSFALAFNADSLTVVETETEGTYKVMFSKDADMLVECGEEGKMTVKVTRGLAAYPAEKMELALATGWISPELNDIQRQERFADTGFTDALADIAMEQMKKTVVATGWDCTWDNVMNGLAALYVKVQNNSDQKISANDYTVTSIVTVRDNWGNVPPQRGHISTLDIKPHQTVRLRVNMDDYPVPESKSQISVNSTVNFNLSKEDLLARFYKPTGNEYKEYLNGLKTK